MYIVGEKETILILFDVDQVASRVMKMTDEK